MIKQKVFFIIIVFFPLMTIAKTISYVGLGFNKTALRREGGKSKIDDSMSLGLEYYAPFGLILGAEISYVNKNVTLENKTWIGSFDPKDSDIYYAGNIPIDPSCLEMAIKVGYNFPIKKVHKLSVNIFAGPYGFPPAGIQYSDSRAYNSS